jgi:hypothetical protein
MDIKNSIVAILNTENEIVGTGFVAAEHLIVTCAHVIDLAKAAPGGMVRVRFAVDNSERFADIDASSYSPKEDLDIAILRVSQTPKGVQPLRMSASAGCSGHEFFATGYPKLGDFESLSARGEIISLEKDKRGDRYLQLRSQEVAPGLSGGPVMDVARNVVVGMVNGGFMLRSDKKHRDTAFATPSEILWQVCPQLKPAPIVVPNQINDFLLRDYTLDELFVDDIKKLTYKSRLVLGGIKNKLANGLEIRREKISDEINLKFSQNRLLVFRGEAGSGKSAYAKTILAQLENHVVFAFKADSFSKASLKEMFPEIENEFEVLFQWLDEKFHTVILIDSLEKLLEIRNYDALNELLRYCDKLTNIKLIITCRDFAWQQIQFDLHGDFPKYDFVEISPLTDEELGWVEQNIPDLADLFQKSSIKALIRKPFYLSLLVSHSEIAQNKEIVSEKSFKKVIWDQVIAKGIHKRASIFENIAVQRALSMSLYAKIPNSDAEIIQGLLLDEIILAEESLGESYCPSHDVFEDLALTRFIGRVFLERRSSLNFFEQLDGKEPAIRRAFRLWLNDQLYDTPAEITSFISEILEGQEIEQYWQDEIIIAILQSNHCKDFFEIDLEILQKNNWALFLRFIYLLRTACQEPDGQLIQKINSSIQSAYDQWLYLKPYGPGWGMVIDFIDNHFDELDSYKPLIYRLIVEDWSKLLTNDSKLPLEAKSAGKILLSILREAKNAHDDGSNKKYLKIDIDKGIVTIFKLCSLFQSEVEDLITSAVSYNNSNSTNYRIRDFYASIIKYTLSGLYSQEVCKELPDVVCQAAQHEWLLQATEADEYKKYGRDFDIGADFGLGRLSEINYSPAGIYKTPIRFLLYYHPDKALNLIVTIINLATKSYAKSKRGIENGVTDIDLHREDGSKIVQTGDPVIWGMHRGFVQATPDLLQSILMSLEYWLLELCQVNQDWTDKLIKFSFIFLLKNSTSVATSAVLASIGLAYPEKVGKFCFPLLRVKEFYEWDKHRWQGDQFPFAPADLEIYFAQEEKHKFNRLPHRKYHLEYLLTKLQTGGYWEEVNQILDEFQRKVDENDKKWKLALNRMDIRKYEIDATIETPEKNQVAIVPKIDDDLVEIVEKNKIDMEILNRAASISNWARQVFDKDKNAEISFERWKKEYQTYISLNNDDERIESFAQPTYLAAVGVRDFRNNLDSAEMDWCIAIMLESIFSRITQALRQDVFGSVIFIEPVIATLPYLLLLNLNDEIKTGTKNAIFLSLIHLPNEKPFPFDDLRSSLWAIDETFAKSCLAGLLEYAKTYKQGRHYYNDNETSKKELEKFRKQEFELVEKVCKGEIATDISSLSFKTHSHWYLGYATQIIPPNTHDMFFRDYIKIFFDNLFQILRYRDHKEQDYSNYIDTEHKFRDYLALFLLQQENSYSQQFFSYILDQVLGTKGQNIDHNAYEFVDKTIEQMLILQDGLNTSSFWELIWVLENKIKETQDFRYIRYLFLSMPWWESDAEDWLPLRNKKVYYGDIIKTLGIHDVKSVIKLLSGIGAKILLPDGIIWLKGIIESSPEYIGKLSDSDSFIYTEKLIRRVYNLHRRMVKATPELRMSFLFILDHMINAGSSLAFIIRERIITV